MITIDYRCLAIKCDTIKVKKIAQKILNLLDYSSFDLGILLTDNKVMLQYNNKYRNKNKPTDILSFSYHPALKPKERIKPRTKEDKNLGDLIISLEYVKNDAPNWDQTFEERLYTLLVHGVCHLLGYDHKTDKEYDVMKAQEDYILEKLHKS